MEQGKRADLMLLDADPLADIRNTTKRAGVMVRGRWLPQAEIERRLAEVGEGGTALVPHPEAAERPGPSQPEGLR